MNIFDYMQDVGRPIAYYPRMAHFFGSVNASIMFSQLFYWQDRTTNELGVYKTAEEWTEETGLSYREQATARAYLVKQGFLIETHKRIEHRIYYKLNRDAICHAFDLWRQGQKTTSDESAIPERRKRNSGTTIQQSGECAIRNSGTTIPQPVYKTETTSETTQSNTPKPPAQKAPGASGSKATAISLATWLSNLKASGELPIPEDDPVFEYAEQAGIPLDMLRLCWIEFRSRYSEPGAKRYKDWRSVYRKAVRGNWLKLWFCNADGYTLTTAGLQAQRVLQAKEGAAA